MLISNSGLSLSPYTSHKSQSQQLAANRMTTLSKNVQKASHTHLKIGCQLLCLNFLSPHGGSSYSFFVKKYEAISL